MPRIRLLRLIARLNIGGPAIHVIALAARLDPSRYESRLVTGVPAPHEGDMGYLAEAASVQPFVIPEMGREVSPLDDAAAFVKVYRLMREFRPHLVHTHTAKAGALGRLAARLAGVPVVVHTYHGHVFRGYFGRLKSRLTVAAERGLARLTDRLITVSERVRDEIAAFGVAPPDQIEVIPLGFDLAPFANGRVRRGGFRASLGVMPDEFLIGSVGRLAPIKNHRMFLRAASTLRANGHRAKFVIVGDGEMRDELQAEARRLGLDGDVFFTGWRRDLPAIYADLDALANTSLNEGTPVAVIEAMAARVPVVATSVGGVPDVIADGRTGRLIPSDDADALARTLAEIAAQREASLRLAEAASAEVTCRYSMENLIHNIDSLYRRLLATKGLA